MDQRVRFISEYLDEHFAVAELCRQFSISRKTGYKWLTRHEKYGALGLEDRTRAARAGLVSVGCGITFTINKGVKYDFS